MKNLIKGGKSDNMSLNDIAKMHHVTIEELEKQLKLGIQIELEHVDNKKMAEEIAKDHLYEDPFYYTSKKPENWAEKELKHEEIYEYVKNYEDFLKENTEDTKDGYIQVSKDFKDKIELLKQRAKQYHSSSNKNKLRIMLSSNFNEAFNLFIDSLNYKNIHELNSIEAENEFKQNFKNILLDILKGTHYYFSQGKFTDLNKLSFEDFLNIYNKELDSFSYNDLIQNFKNRSVLANQVSENIFKEVERRG